MCIRKNHTLELRSQHLLLILNDVSNMTNMIFLQLCHYNSNFIIWKHQKFVFNFHHSSSIFFEFLVIEITLKKKLHKQTFFMGPTFFRLWVMELSYITQFPPNPYSLLILKSIKNSLSHIGKNVSMTLSNRESQICLIRQKTKE